MEGIQSSLFHHLSAIICQFDYSFLCQQPDCLDDLSFAIMSEMSKMCYRVSDDDVTRARNQVYSSLLYGLICFFPLLSHK